MFKNKHVIMALIITPVLAIIAWFAIGTLVEEKPHKAVAGQSYPLVERSNCRYPSGQCDLSNEEFKVSLSVDNTGAKPILLLRASHPLDGALIAIADQGVTGQPAAMLPKNIEHKEWTLALQTWPQPDHRIQLVANAADITWYAEASTAFLEPEQP